MGKITMVYEYDGCDIDTMFTNIIENPKVICAIVEDGDKVRTYVRGD